MKTLLAATLLLCSAHSLAWRDALPPSQLVGEGELRWFGLSIYTVRLWSPAAPQQLTATIPEAAVALELTYHRSITRERFVETSLEEIERLSGAKIDAARLSRWREAMQRAFVDVEAGMRITGVYLPGEGCRFYVNDRLQHHVADPDFAAAFFAIWLDPRSRDRNLRQRLLGGALT